MDLYHLHTFYRVARLLSFTRAAEELSLSQSAVSRHIEALEREYGIELFARKGRGAALTEAGTRLVPYAERLLHIAREASRAMGELTDLTSGHLIVGASTTPGHYVLGPVMAAYQARYPGIDLQLEIRDSQAMVRRVEDGLVDLAVIPELATTPGITSEPCLPDALMLIAAANHPLAAREQVGLRDVAAARLYLREPGSHTRQVVEEAFAARGLAPADVRVLSSTEAIKQAVAAGAGVAFCSRYALALELQSGLLKALPGPDLPLTRQFVIAFPKGGRRSPSALAFAALLRKMRTWR